LELFVLKDGQIARRNFITNEDMLMVIRVVLSTAPIERVAIFDLLLAMSGTLTTSDITTGLNTTKPTALRTMTELKALGLGFCSYIVIGNDDCINHQCQKQDAERTENDSHFESK
jgi:CRP-like cAMP-binding protein